MYHEGGGGANVSRRGTVRPFTSRAVHSVQCRNGAEIPNLDYNKSKRHRIRQGERPAPEWQSGVAYGFLSGWGKNLVNLKQKGKAGCIPGGRQLRGKG